MALDTNTFTEYATNGTKQIREDLAKQIYNVDPYRTPLLNMAKKARATNTYHEWTVDVIPAQNTGNAQLDGDALTADQLYAAGRMGNYTQISRKVCEISGTMQAVNTVGKFGTMGYQLLKASKALKRDMEGILTANAAQNAGAAGTARVSGGITSYLTVNNVFQSGGSPAGANPSGVVAAGNSINFGNGTTARTDNSTTSAITETNVRTLALNVYKNSGDSIEYLLCSPANKQNISAFTGPAGTRFNQIVDKRFATAIDVYESDFGPTKVVPDIFLARSKDVFAVNPEYVGVAYLRPFQTVPVAKDSDADRKAIVVEYCLEVRNERALGGIFDTTG